MEKDVGGDETVENLEVTVGVIEDYDLPYHTRVQHL